MRTHTLVHGQLGFEYRIVEVPAWRCAVARGTENLLGAIGHPCCRWGWAHGLLSAAMNVEFSAEEECCPSRSPRKRRNGSPSGSTSLTWVIPTDI